MSEVVVQRRGKISDEPVLTSVISDESDKIK